MLRVSSSAPIDEREHRFRHEFSLVSYITLDFALLPFFKVPQCLIWETGGGVSHDTMLMDSHKKYRHAHTTHQRHDSKT